MLGAVSTYVDSVVLSSAFFGCVLYLLGGALFWSLVVVRQVARDAARGDAYAIHFTADAQSGDPALWVVFASVILLWPFLLAYGLLVFGATRCKCFARWVAGRTVADHS